jgi:inhibitor of cysteine peptidase
MRKTVSVFMMILALGLLAGCEKGVDPTYDDADLGLASLESYEQLESLVEDQMTKEYWSGSFRDDAMTETDSPTNDDVGSGDTQSHSTTNVQVEGVDEGDVIKTDGNRIYRIKYNELQVVDLLEGGQMEIILEGSMDTANDDTRHTYFNDLYLTDDELVVIGQRYHHFILAMDGGVMESREDADIVGDWYWYGVPQTYLMIYDLETLALKEEIEITGNLMTTRLIDDNLYVISSHYVYMYEDDVDPRPFVRVGDEVMVPEYNDIKYIPDMMMNAFTMVTKVDLEDEIEVDFDIFLGDSSWGQIYVSTEAIYLATTTYTWDDTNETIRSKGTLLSYTFNEDGSIAYGGVGYYDGYVINQFAMDEYDGTFRMVTTEGWGDSVKNRLYVFQRTEEDGKRILKRIGFLDEGIGKPRETVYSVRFNGTMATVVTYEQIDPLYTIDLSDPTNPVIRAGLEVSGYSTYQHPWGDHYIVGIGYEAEGNLIEGLKVALFDVSDPDNPVEVGEPLIIPNDGGWTSSEAIWNHKAILVAEELGFLGFAVSRYHWTSYEYYFSNDYMIFKIDPESETPVTIEAAISHQDLYLEDREYFDAWYRYYYDFSIERAVYVGDYLYAISGEAVTSHDMTDGFKRIAAVKFLNDDIIIYDDTTDTDEGSDDLG